MYTFFQRRQIEWTKSLPEFSANHQGYSAGYVAGTEQNVHNHIDSSSHVDFMSGNSEFCLGYRDGFNGLPHRSAPKNLGHRNARKEVKATSALSLRVLPEERALWEQVAGNNPLSDWCRFNLNLAAMQSLSDAGMECLVKKTKKAVTVYLVAPGTSIPGAKKRKPDVAALILSESLAFDRWTFNHPEVMTMMDKVKAVAHASLEKDDE
jgi:hypothetical protein